MAEIAIHDVTLIDGTGGDARSHQTVVIDGRTIRRLGPAGIVDPLRGATVIDGRGLTLLPGLIDAHSHVGITDVTLADRLRRPLAVYAMQVARTIEQVLDQGFTTLRDAGMLDGGWAHAVAAGYLRGPRILPSGGPLSQTGGHGDIRNRFDEAPQRTIPGLYTSPAIVDGPEAVRAAARAQLRHGATQIKVMASGGAMSPADELDHTQLSVEEIAAAVDVARAAGTYVLAHAYHPRAIRTALDAGVRSIEHGNFIDEETAARMAAAGAFLVPTLVTYEQIDLGGEAAGVPSNQIEKIRAVRRAGDESVRIARAAGVRIGSGSDLLGDMQTARARELTLKAGALSPAEAIVSATRTNAELLMMADRIGTVEEGKLADLVLVACDPIAEIAALEDAANVVLVLKEGTVMKQLERAEAGVRT